MNHPGSSHRSGFSLLEVIVAMSVFVLLVSMIATLTILFQRVLIDVTNHSDFEQTIRRSLHVLGRDARMAESFTLYDSNDLDITRLDKTTVAYTFSPQSRELSRKEGSNGTVNTIMSDIEFLAFAHPDGDPSAIQVHVSMAKAAGSRESARTVEVRYAQRKR